MKNESGNVFFYLFLCVSLLAALSFAVSQGGRGAGGKLTEDRRRLIASEIIGFGDTVGKAVTQLRLRGIAETQLSFASPFLSAGYGTYAANPAAEIFNPSGGAVVYRPVPEGATASTRQYSFLANNMVENIGSTCGTPDCVDLVMAAQNLDQSVCQTINDLLGVTNAGIGGTPPSDTALEDTTLYAPGADPFNNAGTVTIGDEDSALSGQREACFEDGGGIFIYYKVLLPR